MAKMTAEQEEHIRWSINKTEKDGLLALTDTMGDRITQAMEDNDISISWLAQNMGVVDRTISDWRKDGNVSTHRIPLLAHFLSLDPGYLLTGTFKDSFHQRSADAEVVQFERPVDRSVDDGAIKSVITRHVPLFEVDELATMNDPSHFLSSLPDWMDNPEKRGAIVVSISPEALDLPGIPLFAIQVLVDNLRDFNYGDYVGFAPDLVPIEGSYALFAHRERGEKWRVTPGYFSTPGALCFTDDVSDAFSSLNDFWIKQRLDETHTADIHITPDCEWAFIGTATYISRWLDKVHQDMQTGVRSRLRRRYRSRINQKVKELELGAYGC